MAFTLELASNSSLNVYPENTLASFRTVLIECIELFGHWEVSLLEISYPRNIFNIVEGTFDLCWPNSPRLYKGCKMRKGMYHTIEEIRIEMNNAIDRKRERSDKLIEHLDFQYDSSHVLKICSSTKASEVHFISVSKDLQYILGLERKKLIGRLLTYVPTYAADINRFHHLFIYCDFIDPQFVGENKAPLLQSCPVFDVSQKIPGEAVKPGGFFGYYSSIIRSSHQAQFKKVAKQSIGDVLIEIRSESGELLPFVGDGRTQLTLQLRQITI